MWWSQVFNAAEAFHSGRLKGCASVTEAKADALGQFSHEVQLLQRVAGGSGAPALGGTVPPWMTLLPSCSNAVVTMLDYSKDQGGRPGRSADGCCYLVLELGLFTMEQLARDSRAVGRKPGVPEVREAVGSLLGMVAELHRCGCVLASNSPRHVMRFPSGWKLLAVDVLRPVDTLLEADPAAANPLYLSPEFAAALLARSGHVQLRPSMDVWGVALVCLELLLPKPLLQEPHARVLARNKQDANAFLRWLSHESGPPALPAAVHDFSPALHSMLQLLLQRDSARRISAVAAQQHAFFTEAHAAPPTRRRADAADTLSAAATPSASAKLKRSAEGARKKAAAVATPSTPTKPSPNMKPSPNKPNGLPTPSSLPEPSSDRGGGGGGGGTAREAELERREAAATRREVTAARREADFAEFAQTHRATTEEAIGLEAKGVAPLAKLQALQAQLQALQAQAQQSGVSAQAKVDNLHAQLQISQRALQASQQALQASQTVATEQTARAVAAERELAALQQPQEGEAVPQLRAALNTAQAELQVCSSTPDASAAPTVHIAHPAHPMGGLGRAKPSADPAPPVTLQDALEAAQAELQGAAVLHLLGPPPESAAPVPGSGSELDRLRIELDAARQETIAVARAAGTEVAAAASAAASGAPPVPLGVSSGSVHAAQEEVRQAKAEVAQLQTRIEASTEECRLARAEVVALQAAVQDRASAQRSPEEVLCTRAEAAQVQTALVAAQEALETAQEAARLEAVLLQTRAEVAQEEAARARAELAQVKPLMPSAQLKPRPHPK